MVDVLPSSSRPSTLQLNGEAVPHWASRLSLPAGILFEIEHKSTGRVVVSSQTFEAGNAPRVSVPEGALFAHEVYLLRVLASTSRYKRKFVTTVYYRPVHVATPAAEGAKTRTSAAGEGGAPEGEDFGRGSKLSTSDARAIDSR